ncbi:MAG TPA: hypothetical protein VG675_00390 [Bryobacteraceae bacterium]|nr:hypothetical protein [Bryobacteraceae bacterium]
MAATAISLCTGSIRVNLVDGTRRPVADEFQTFLRILDGRGREASSSFVRGPLAIFAGLVFRGNANDHHTVCAHAERHRGCPLFPVRVIPNVLSDAGLMLLPEDGRFLLDPLEAIESAHPRIRRLLANNTRDVCSRYRHAIETQPRSLAALLNLATALESIPLPDPLYPTPLDYDWQVEWDLMSPDRFWAWADIRLIDHVRRAAALHCFAPDASPEFFHSGIAGRVGPGTHSWKEVRLETANLRLTFHEYDRRTLDFPDGQGGTRAVDCVMAEIDMEFDSERMGQRLGQAQSTAREETAAPEMAYQLRWMATRQEGLPEFNPPLRIEA